MQETKVIRNYKDTVFRMLYSDKKELLSLYNALNDTAYQDTQALHICTLENAIYMNVKNDVSFIVGSELNLYEQQSTYNPNMPLRNLIYMTRQLEAYVQKTTIYSSRLVRIPVPRFVVFYNGTEKQPERKILRLSDAFEKRTPDPELELKVLMLNLGKGQNREFLNKCRTLKEYCLFVEKVRVHGKALPVKDAVERAVTECIRQGILEDFLRKQRAEVVAMSIFEYNEEEELKKIRADEYEIGRMDGERIGRVAGKAEAILDFLGELGSIPDTVRMRIENEKNVEVLRKWLREAAAASSIDEFVRRQ